MRLPITVCVSALVVVFVACGGGNQQQVEPPKKVAAQPKVPDDATLLKSIADVAFLSEEAEKNMVAFKAMMGSDIIAIRGRVEEISSPGNSATVKLVDTDEKTKFYVRCRFERDVDVLPLQKGNTVVIAGQFDGHIVVSLIFKNCRILKEAK